MDNKLWNRTKYYAKINGIENWFDIYLEYWKSGGRGMIPKIDYAMKPMKFIGFTPDYKYVVCEDNDGNLVKLDRLVFHRIKKKFENTSYEDIDMPKFIQMNIQDIEFLILGKSPSKNFG